MKKVSQSFLFIDCDTLLMRYLRCQYSHSRFVTGHLILTWTLYHVTAGMCKYFSPPVPRAPPGLKPYNSSFVFVRKLYIYVTRLLFLSHTPCPTSILACCALVIFSQRVSLSSWFKCTRNVILFVHTLPSLLFRVPSQQRWKELNPHRFRIFALCPWLLLIQPLPRQWKEVHLLPCWPLSM